MAHSELVDIVDEHNNIIGSADAATAHAQKLRHRVVGVFVFDAGGNLYVQTANKYGKYDLSVGGHVRQGESYDEAAQREMLEEIGLQAPLKHISTFLPENARMNHFWAIYETTVPGGWAFSETEEVKALEKMKMRDIILAIDADPEKFTGGFINTMKEFARVTVKK